MTVAFPPLPKNRIVGFTGRRDALPLTQKVSLSQVIHELNPSEFHHGDCVGADHEAHYIVYQETQANIRIHPPVNNRYRAFCSGDPARVLVLPMRRYISRNHDIVDVCNILLAAPATYDERVRSGTWATIRYARRADTTVVIVYPQGQVEVERL